MRTRHIGSSSAQRGRGTTQSVVEGATPRTPLPAFGGTPPASRWEIKS
jgi:hypothetical protein